jgi:hypothetical protein
VPFDRSFVRHMEGWYAQKHPDEDFAETFAVWLHAALALAARASGRTYAQTILDIVELARARYAERPARSAGRFRRCAVG